MIPEQGTLPPSALFLWRLADPDGVIAKDMSQSDLPQSLSLLSLYAAVLLLLRQDLEILPSFLSPVLIW